jgi:membrane-associated two-gene conflict system component 1 (EACC1)
MTAAMRIHTEGAADLASLQAMLRGLDEIRATPHESAPEPGRLGSGADYLAVLCSGTGAVAAVLAVVRAWLQSRITVIRIEAGDAAFSVTGRNAETVLPQVRDALLAVRAATPPLAEHSTASPAAEHSATRTTSAEPAAPQDPATPPATAAADGLRTAVPAEGRDDGR